jgi:endonuclease/exonuclease/phosphatase family metal-dependent hydrolase
MERRRPRLRNPPANQRANPLTSQRANLLPMPQVKVATLNLFNRSGEWGHRAPLVLDQFERLKPDVIGLQEVDMVLDQGMWISKQINVRMGTEHPHYRIKHAVNPGQRASFHGIATMSCIGFEEHEIVDLLTHERNAQRFVFRMPDGAQAPSPVDVAQPRLAVGDGAQAPSPAGNPFFLINTHLHWPPEAQQDRVDQLEYLLEWHDRDARGYPLIILGDFNAYADPPEPATVLMKSRFRSAVETANGREPEKTWTTPVNTYDTSPHGTLDYIFISKEWRVVEAGLAFDQPAPHDKNIYPSDHLGLYAILEL